MSQQNLPTISNTDLPATLITCIRGVVDEEEDDDTADISSVTV